MTFKYSAAFAASGILTAALLIFAGVPGSKAAELAGADEEDKMTRDQLLNPGQTQLPAPYIKVTESRSTPSTKPAPETLSEMKIAEPDPQLERVEPTKKGVKPEPKLAQPVKRAAEVAPKVTPTVEKNAAAEWDQSTNAAPYIRMDVGYGLTLNPKGTTMAGAMTGENVANLTLFGAGIGYRFSEDLRVDLTADYSTDARVDAITPSGATVSSEVNGLTVLLNGYYDIGPFEGSIPYVGGGVGFARLKTTAQTGTVTPGDTSTNFAWAVGVGSAVDLGNGDNTMADVSYRFSNVGDFQQQDGTSYHDMMTHEFRVGFRHHF